MNPSSKKRIAVLVSGRGSNMAALLSAGMAPDYPARVVAVLSDNPDAGGLAHATANGVEAIAVPRNDFATKQLHEAAILEVLDEIAPDFVCLAGYMRLLSAEFVARWSGRIINIHPSLLPLFPGLDTHIRALQSGVRLHGCSVHFVTSGMDEGPLIAQAACAVQPDDTAGSLAARVLKLEHQLYPAALRLLASGDVRLSGDGHVSFRSDGGDDTHADREQFIFSTNV